MCIFRGGPIDGHREIRNKAPRRIFVAYGPSVDDLEPIFFLHNSKRDFKRADYGEAMVMHVYSHTVSNEGVAYYKHSQVV